MSEYFGKKTDKYILEYIEATDRNKKNEIFQNYIRPSFEKLIENQIYVYGFFNIDEIDSLRNDALVNLYELLPKYNPAKGSKCFSYFNVVLKNWFFQKSRELNKRRKIEGENQETLENSKNELIIDSCEDDAEKAEFWGELFKTFEQWRQLLTKANERLVLEAIIFLMKHPELVPLYSKKAILLYIRDITGLNGKQVRLNLKKIRTIYLSWKKDYYKDVDDEEY
jgi:hypothetical protein